MRLLFVCLGNICRSPTAEGVMRHLLREEGLEDAITVDSAGTGGWHVGDPPDRRSAAAARARGIALGGASRMLTRADFDAFDLIVVMDAENRRDAERLVGGDEHARAKIAALREFDPEAVAAGDLDVPDPYYGGEHGFERVLDVVERACRGLLEHVRARAA